MSKKVLNAINEGDLIIGDLKIPSAVLEDKTRVLNSKGFLTAIGRSWKGSSRTDLPNFLGAKNLIPFVSEQLRVDLIPIEYRNKRGKIIKGFKAELIPLVCDVYLKAREAQSLSKTQEAVAQKAEILVRSLSKIGIIALIDEATGYQYDRDRNELYQILEAYVNKEFLPWTKRFPDEFYENLFRLKGWTYNPLTVKRPKLVGKLISELVYKKLPKGVLDELKRKTPKSPKGNYTKRFHQSLTEDIGNPHLEKHLVSVITLMKISPNWRKFKSYFVRAFGGQTEFDFEEED
jgi:P63C domain.